MLDVSSQQRADDMLSRRHLTKQLSGDIGALTFTVREIALDLFEVWMQRPYRRIEFGSPEREDIREALRVLGDLLLEMDGVRAIETDYAA